MAKLTLQEQLLKAGLVTSKKAAKVERTAKKSRVQAREARAAVEENKKRKKTALLDTAYHLFTQNGYQKTSISDFASATLIQSL